MPKSLDFEKISDNISRDELLLIVAIAKRAHMEIPELNDLQSPATTIMDLEVTHSDCPLSLESLLKARGYDFAHDILGIRRHINRQTGQLEDCFLPRYAMPQLP